MTNTILGKDTIITLAVLLIFLILYCFITYLFYRRTNKEFINKIRSSNAMKFVITLVFIALPFIAGLALYYIRTTYYPSEKDQFFSDVIYNPSIALFIPLFFIVLQKLDELLTEKDNKPTIKIKTESATIESSSTHLNANEIEVAAENIDVSSAQINVDAKNTTANATQANIVSSKADIKTQNATIRNVAESSDTKEPK